MLGIVNRRTSDYMYVRLNVNVTYEQVAGAYTVFATLVGQVHVHSVHVRKYTCIYMYVHVRMPVNSPLENFTPYNLALYKLAPHKVASWQSRPARQTRPSSLALQTHTRLFLDASRYWDWFNINIRVFTCRPISHYYNKAGCIVRNYFITLW